MKTNSEMLQDLRDFANKTKETLYIGGITIYGGHLFSNVVIEFKNDHVRYLDIDEKVSSLQISRVIGMNLIIDNRGVSVSNLSRLHNILCGLKEITS